jgi:hypothetical protein
VTLGVLEDVQPRQLADAAGRLLGDAVLRARMAARARMLVDGRGAIRVADLVTAGLS